MKHAERHAPTLEEALRQPCQHRDMALALEPMPNHSSTPGGPHGQPLAFWASWDLADRPRRIALLVDDCQEEYRPYARDILPNVKWFVEAFRAARSSSDGVGIAWSAWSRACDDGISNAMDRWYGPRGLRPEEPENAAYVFTGSAGMKPLAEIAPTEAEELGGWFYLGQHLDMFWTFDAQGASYLDEKLEALAIDTIVIVGLWTDIASSAPPTRATRAATTSWWSATRSPRPPPTRRRPCRSPKRHGRQGAIDRRRAALPGARLRHGRPRGRQGNAAPRRAETGLIGRSPLRPLA